MISFSDSNDNSLNKDDFLIPTYVKKSSIPEAGDGRFFSNDCKAGTIIRVQSIEKDLTKINSIDDISVIDEKLIDNFAHSKTITDDCNTSNIVYINKKPLFTNHSNDNNITFQYIDDQKITYTTRNVKKDDEVFQNYCEYTQVPWFEEYLHSKGKISLREFGMELKMSEERMDTNKLDAQ
tara:strand:- start:1068 stop:1607 length:540 start_codon:yes stop_codon:yes gene_type:complete